MHYSYFDNDNQKSLTIEDLADKIEKIESEKFPYKGNPESWIEK